MASTTNQPIIASVSSTNRQTNVLNTLPAHVLSSTLLLDRYQLLSLVGVGGFSSVYSARDVRTGNTVAIKMLHDTVIEDAALVRRFWQEAKTSSLLSHPNIVAFLSSNQTASGQPFIVMEYLEGKSLQHVLRREGGSLPWPRAQRIFLQIAAALNCAHSRGIVHRDIKPSNIMVRESGGADEIKVFDFGIAKEAPSRGAGVVRLTHNGEALGTPPYMSPEQCQRLELDGRSDIYSLGCLMYETLTGRVPFLGNTGLETIYQQLTRRPERFTNARPDFDLPASAEAIVLRALEKEPAARYQSAFELGQDLQKALSL